MRKVWIYTIFLMVFGLFFERLEKTLGTPAFAAIVVIYALIARIVSERFGRP